MLTINIDLPGLNEGAHDLLADPRPDIEIESIFVSTALPLCRPERGRSRNSGAYENAATSGDREKILDKYTRRANSLSGANNRAVINRYAASLIRFFSG